MRREHKVCDRCKAEGYDDELQLFEIGVTCKNLTYQRAVESFPKQEWCKECVSQTALLGISEKEAEERRQKSLAPVVPVTFEDIIREIASEVAQDEISSNRFGLLMKYWRNRNK